jgi:hypothetical protein
MEIFCQSFNFKSLASAIVICKCLLAMITPLIKSTTQLGQITVNLALFLRSPETLIGAFTHSLNPSDLRISSCVCFLNGKSTLTFFISHFSHFIVTVSSHAYCHG